MASFRFLHRAGWAQSPACWWTRGVAEARRRKIQLLLPQAKGILGNLRLLEHHWNSNQMRFWGGGVGMEVVCGERKGPRVSCGNGFKRLGHQTSIFLPGIVHNTGLLVVSWRQNWEGTKIQISQVSLLNRTLTEGCRKPGQSSVTLASMFAILNWEPLNARSERKLDGHIIPWHENEV